MRRKCEPVAIILTSPSISDEDDSDIEANNKGLGKRMKEDSDPGMKQPESNINAFEEQKKYTIVEKSSPNTHPTTKLIPIDPILILKDRPSKPALKSCTLSREDKDVKVRLCNCDFISNDSTLDSSCSIHTQGDQSCCNSMHNYFYITLDDFSFLRWQQI